MSIWTDCEGIGFPTCHEPIFNPWFGIILIVFLSFLYWLITLKEKREERKMTFKELSKKLYPFIATPLLIIVCLFLGLNIAFLISTYLDFIRTFHFPMLWIILYLCVSVGVQLNYVDKVSKNIKEELRGKNGKERNN